MFAAALPADPQTFVGAAAIYDYDPEDYSYGVGRLLLDSRNPACHGLGRELVRCICMIADQQLPGLIKTNCALRAEVYSDNERSLRCFLTNGFQISGEKQIQLRRVTILHRPSGNH